MTEGASLRARLEALAAFADELDAPDFDAGRWHASEVRHTPAGEVRTMPWFEASERADAFTRTAVGSGWVEPFDWMTDHATPDQLQRLLTAAIRAERFSDGSLEWAFKSGLMAAIARRAGVLADEQSG